jgi:hypothetical protein
MKNRLLWQDKVAKEGQSGKTAFSQGGVNGPNKLEGLVAFGNLKAGVAITSFGFSMEHPRSSNFHKAKCNE